MGAKLQTAFPKLWINNAGLDGHSTFGHVILLRDVLLKLHPKVLLFLVGANDVGRDDLVRQDRLSLRDEAPAWKQVMITISEQSRFAAWLENMTRALAARRRGLAHHDLELGRLATVDISPQTIQTELKRHKESYVSSYKKRLEQLISSSRLAGILPVLITQPALFGGGKDDVTGVDLKRVEVTKGENGDVAWRVLELYNDATRSVAREKQVPLIDLAHEMPKTSRYFYDFYHFTNAGSEAAASIVSKDLQPVLTASVARPR